MCDYEVCHWNIVYFSLADFGKNSYFQGLSVIGGLDYWNGLLEWTTGMDFDLFFFSFPKS